MKKVIIFVVGMLLTAVLICGCGEHDVPPLPETPDSSIQISDTDITVETDKIELSDGKWNYDIRMPQNYWEYGSFVVSDNATKLTYTKIYEGKNAYGGEMSESRFEAKNQNPEINMKTTFNDSSEFNTDTKTFTIKTNASKTKFKSVYTDGENTTTTLLEKVE